MVSLRVVQLLRQERQRRGMSLNELAARSSLSRSMVSYVERGLRNPTLDTVLRIANALGVDLWRVLKAALRPG